MNAMKKMKKTNYHTHSLFCDGKNSVEEMVLSAIEKGFDILGFSSHSMCRFSDDWHLKVEEHSAYAEEVRRVKREYSDKISIQLGFEADYIYGLCKPHKADFRQYSPDYLIGAVHYVMNENGCFAVDDSEENVKAGLENVFGGNKRELVHAYFESERKMIAKGDFNIIAHADLIRKHNAKLELFDEEASEYKEELKLTAKEIKRAGVIAEINTGGVARGYLKEPYPSPYFLSLLSELKVPVTYSSDAHKAQNLDFGYEETLAYIKKADYKEIAYLEDGSLKLIRL